MVASGAGISGKAAIRNNDLANETACSRILQAVSLMEKTCHISFSNSFNCCTTVSSTLFT